MEDRRTSADRFAWAVPTVIIASQSFLIPFALNDQTSDGARVFACAAALVLTAATGHFFWKQTFAILLFEQVAKQQRAALGYFQPDRNALLVNAGKFDSDFKDRWLAKSWDGKFQFALDADGDWYYQPKRLIRWTVRRVWAYTIIAVLIADVALLGWAAGQFVASGGLDPASDILQPFWERLKALGNAVSD